MSGRDDEEDGDDDDDEDDLVCPLQVRAVPEAQRQEAAQRLPAHGGAAAAALLGHAGHHPHQARGRQAPRAQFHVPYIAGF